jgi:membrane protease YdiL (CAAX protease family)
MPRAAIIAAGAIVAWNLAFALGPRVGGVWIPVVAAALALDALVLALTPELRRPRPPPARALLWVLGATLVQVAATYLLYRPAAALVPALAGQTTELYRLLGSPNAWQAWLALPLVVVSEELVFRGALQGRLAARLGPWLSTLGASCVYAMAHLASGSWTLVGLAMFCGLYWGALRAITRSLWPAVVCHLLWDWAILVLVPLT